MTKLHKKINISQIYTEYLQFMYLEVLKKTFIKVLIIISKLEPEIINLNHNKHKKLVKQNSFGRFLSNLKCNCNIIKPIKQKY